MARQHRSPAKNHRGDSILTPVLLIAALLAALVALRLNPALAAHLSPDAQSLVKSIPVPTDIRLPTNIQLPAEMPKISIPQIPIFATGLPAISLPGDSPQIGTQTKTSGCRASGGMPDSACTPGTVFPDVTEDDVCVSGYASSVRDVPESIKDQVYEAYDVTSHVTGEYEVDHLISLELGGSNDIANLWPEAAEPRPGFHEKDKVENYLRDEVCNGAMSLAEAQRLIATDWVGVYNQLP